MSSKTRDALWRMPEIHFGSEQHQRQLAVGVRIVDATMSCGCRQVVRVEASSRIRVRRHVDNPERLRGRQRLVHDQRPDVGGFRTGRRHPRTGTRSTHFAECEQEVGEVERTEEIDLHALVVAVDCRLVRAEISCDEKDKAKLQRRTGIN